MKNKTIEVTLPKWILVALWLCLLPIKLLTGDRFIRSKSFDT